MMIEKSNVTISLDEELEEFLEELTQSQNMSIDKLANMWECSDRPSPMPILIPHPNGTGRIPLTPNGYNALERWAKRRQADDTDLKLISNEEWFNYVFYNVLSTLLGILEKVEEEDDTANTYKHIRRQLKAGAIQKHVTPTTYFFGVRYACSPLKTQYSIGPIALIPPTEIEEEVGQWFLDIDDSNPLADSALKENLRLARDMQQGATCVVRVETSGLGKALSEQWARAAVRSTFSALLLPFGIEAARHITVLDEPSHLLHKNSPLTLRSGKPVLPGFSIRWPRLKDGEAVHDELCSKHAQYKSALNRMMTAWLAPPQCDQADEWQCPNLSARWLSSIHWFGRAVTANLDFEAIVFIGASLDGLTESGGKIKHLINRISRILGLDSDRVFFKGPPEKTINCLTKEIYNKGRSEIIHGSRDSLREDLSQLRLRGEIFAQAILYTYGNRLADYENINQPEDDTKAFLRWCAPRTLIC